MSPHLEPVLEGGGQHVGEELERDRQQKLHEGHHHEDDEGYQAEHVSCRACQLPPLTSAGSNKDCSCDCSCQKVTINCICEQMPLLPAGLSHNTVNICQMHSSLQAAAASAAGAHSSKGTAAGQGCRTDTAQCRTHSHCCQGAQENCRSGRTCAAAVQGCRTGAA